MEGGSNPYAGWHKKGVSCTALRVGNRMIWATPTALGQPRRPSLCVLSKIIAIFSISFQVSLNRVVSSSYAYVNYLRPWWYFYLRQSRGDLSELRFSSSSACGIFLCSSQSSSRNKSKEGQTSKIKHLKTCMKGMWAMRKPIIRSDWASEAIWRPISLKEFAWVIWLFFLT